MISRFNVIACCLAVMLLGGCVNAPQIPAELQYAPPPAGTPAARILGSEEKSALLDNFTAFVLMVDGKRVMTGRKGWNTPIMLEPGHRVLTVEFNRGVFVARTEVELDALVGANYTLRYDTDVKLYGTNRYADFWIVDDATSKAVTTIKRGTINGGSNGAFVPIFIPTK